MIPSTSSRNSLCPISFEIFPPNTAIGFEKLQTTCQTLATLQPDYYSVTYGAGGVNQDKTLAATRQLLTNRHVVAPHLTGVGLTREAAQELLTQYQQQSVRHLVVIRGDTPTSAPHCLGDFNHAIDLVQFIRATTGDYFDLTVAAYPEVHPQAVDAKTDVLHLKSKIDAGASSAITQFFFNVEAYLYFRDYCQQHHIEAPIIPGIMPINHYPNLQRFAKLCGADIPSWLNKRLTTYADDAKAMVELGIEVVTKLCQQLIKAGAPALHFYTLNQVEPVYTILSYLGYRHEVQQAAIM